MNNKTIEEELVYYRYKLSELDDQQTELLDEYKKLSTIKLISLIPTLTWEIWIDETSFTVSSKIPDYIPILSDIYVIKQEGQSLRDCHTDIHHVAKRHGSYNVVLNVDKLSFGYKPIYFNDLYKSDLSTFMSDIESLGITKFKFHDTFKHNVINSKKYHKKCLDSINFLMENANN